MAEGFTPTSRAMLAERALLDLYRKVYERSGDKFGDITSGLKASTELAVIMAGTRYDVPVFSDDSGNLIRPIA